MKRLFMLVLPAIWLAWQIPLVAQRDPFDGSGIPDGGGEAA